MKSDFIPLTFDVTSPKIRSAREEWKPHARMTHKSYEWWYLTANAYDVAGNEYFIFFDIVNRPGEGWQQQYNVPPKHTLVRIVGRVSNYDKNHSFAIDGTNIVSENTLWDRAKHAVLCNAGDYSASWSYQDSFMNLVMKSPNVCFDFLLQNVDEVVWHKDKLGVEGMIQQGAEDDFSFYYSLMRTPFTGKLIYTDEQEVKHEVMLNGMAWVDRQWGDFFTLSWEWSSFRFANGARLHLYNFFNGHQEAVYLTTEGEKVNFTNVIVKQNGYVRSPQVGTWVSWGWSYEFPIEIEGSKHYTVIPRSEKDFLESLDLNFALYEGSCRLINDETGEQVGVSINESADIRIMDNGPYGKNQK
jgi:predicted secreted hydrolase